MKKIVSFFFCALIIGCGGSGDDFDDYDESYYEDSSTTGDDTGNSSSDSSNDSSSDSSNDSSSDSSDESETDANDSIALAEGQITRYSVVEGNLTKLVDYNVESELLSYQADTLKHQEIWNQVLKITPESYLSKINEFYVFTGSNSSYELDGTMAYVIPTNDDLTTWGYGLAIDTSYEVDFNVFEDGLNGTIVHEFAHILVLDDTQLNASISQDDCATFFLTEGCSREDSYIYSFYNDYWIDIDENNTEEENYNASPDSYVSEYAAKDITEDMAETFRFYVLVDAPSNSSTISNQKILSYYDNEDFVSLRNSILDNIGTVSSLSQKTNQFSHGFKGCGTHKMIQKKRNSKN